MILKEIKLRDYTNLFKMRPINVKLNVFNRIMKKSIVLYIYDNVDAKIRFCGYVSYNFLNSKKIKKQIIYEILYIHYFVTIRKINIKNVIGQIIRKGQIEGHFANWVAWYRLKNNNYKIFRIKY